MSIENKIMLVRALIEEHNRSQTENYKVSADQFFSDLKKLGGTSEQALSGCTWEDLQSCAGMPKLLARAAAAIFRKEDKQDTPSSLSQKKVDKMTFSELLGQYQPTEENAVSRKLKELSSGKPFIVLVNGAVNVDESVKLLQELRKGYEPRTLLVVNGKPQKVYAVGDHPSELVDENPLYPGRALRPDGECDQLARSWEGVPLEVRQFLRVGLTSGVINGGKMSIQFAHELLDFALQEDAFKKLVQRYPKASLAFDELQEKGELPKLKVSLKKAKSTGGRVEDPFEA